MKSSRSNGEGWGFVAMGVFMILSGLAGVLLLVPYALPEEDIPPIDNPWARSAAILGGVVVARIGVVSLLRAKRNG